MAAGAKHQTMMIRAMLKNRTPICRSLLRQRPFAALLLLMLSPLAEAVPLPPGAALPGGSSTVRGFTVRVAQAPDTEDVPNSFLRALQQINGTLVDAVGSPVPNEAIPGLAPGGAYEVSSVNFERDGIPFDLLNDGNYLTSFTPEMFPGIPGSNFHTNKFVVEVVGFLDLPVGTHTFGICVGADRTDVNDDDNYAVFVARNPRDYFGQKVGEYARTVTSAFGGNQKNENQWTVEVSAAGLYPFRVLYWQTGRGANLQWYTIKSDGLGGEERILVNDTSNPAAIRSYAQTTVANAKGPYVAEVKPVPGSAGNNAAAPIEAVIRDGETVTVPAAGVQMKLNGTTVAATVTRTAPLVKVAFNPNPNRTTPDNLVQLNYTDSSSAAWQSSWNFGINVSGGSATTVTGQWDFDGGNLAATIGQALQYFDPLTQAGTKFGTTAALGVAPIAGQDAKVMEVPGDVIRQIGYVMTHGIAPNGGGTRVNQYTLIMDVFVDTSGPGAASLLQINSLSNTDDGDLFWQGNNFGQGNQGYVGTGQFTAGAWHRMAVAYDLAANPPVVTKYVDGIKQDDWTFGQALDGDRRALKPTAILFADGDQDERRRMWVNSVQIRSGKLKDSEMAALGGPTAAGIPLQIPATTVTGQWDFDQKNLKANVGKALTYFDGPGGLTESGTQFGKISEFLDLPLIDGKDATVMRVPGDVVRQIGYVMDHGIKPNGGGTRVNQYTLIMDVYVAPTGPGAASLIQINSLENTDDGDLFWQGSNFGQGNQGYVGTGQFTAGAWHRMAVAYDLAANPPVVTKFVDGIKQDDWTFGQALDGDRRALKPTAILFADGDQDERREMFVNSIQIREGKLSDAEMYLLGSPKAEGIPVVIPKSTVSGQWDFERGNLSASIGKALAYFDGPGGFTETGTQFGICSELGVPPINGRDARIMKVPGDVIRQIGYVMDHGIKPNGGGTRVNQYTLIMDVYVGTTGPGAASLIQINSLNNTDDGDLFWQGNNFGQGNQGYVGTGQFTAGAWHRMVVSYDLAASPPVVTKFVDGIKQDDWTFGQALDGDRRALKPTAILFADGDQDERREMWVDSIQIRAGRLTDDEMTALGGPKGTAIPVGVPQPEPPPVTESAINPLVVTSVSGNQITLSWPDVSPNGTPYTLEASENMAAGTWTTVPTVGNSAVITAGPGRMFFRLRY
jgi:hypothetical protein